MSKRIDLTGQQFSRLSVIRDSGKVQSGSVVWMCMCDCGKPVEVNSNKLRTGHTRSCGCFRDETTGTRVRKHGQHRSPAYRTWDSMIQRCNNPGSTQYYKYGARGVTVCEEWGNFINFYRDMGDRPEGHTIDRKDNDLGYFKENCRWATPVEQAQNKRTPCTSFARAEEIRSLREDGASRKEIAQETGIGLGSIGGIIYANKVSKPR